ncbi:hypothetical protein IKG64_02900 [Candidatus Saccharibacteria bacterium]|nr:hypothetical protein [Candidatus Saccharibacteria bacterium]
MPSWNIHLEAGNRLADKIKLKGKPRKAFLLGCLLPDINNGYINKVKVKKQHEETHYAFDDKSSLNFYKENKSQITARDPIFLGYLFHLYTDGFFNYDFYRTIKHHPLGDGLTHPEKREIKHHDFWIYDTNFQHHLKINHQEALELAKLANQIPATDITAEDIEDVERILKDTDINSAIRGQKYLFYTKPRLDHLLDNMINSFVNDYLENSNA